MLKIIKKEQGISLLLSLGFSITLLISASMITTAINSAQKNIRNIEDVNLAFFAAEAGIEEAMYYKSWHRIGFEDSNDNILNGWQKLVMNNSDAVNLFNQWNIESRINEVRCTTDPNKCKGVLPFGKSVAFNFSYDDNDKNNTTNFEHNYDSSIKIDFYHDLIYTNLQDDDTTTTTINETNLATISWLASYIDNNTKTTARLLPLHDKDDIYGKEADDCYNNSNGHGKFICRDKLRLADDETTPVNFNVSNQFKGLDINKAEKNLNDFYGSTDATWQKLKFFYINIIPGDSNKPPLDKVNYNIRPPSSGDDIVAPKTIITSTGRSGDVISNLEIKFDNTQESQAFDYGALLD